MSGYGRAAGQIEKQLSMVWMGFSVKCYLPTILLFAVKLPNFLMFTVSGENAVNCFEGIFVETKGSIVF